MICRLHQQAITQMQDRVGTLLQPDTAAKSTPTELLGVHYVMALTESYQGHMSEAIAQWEESYRIALADLPESVPMMQEVLGDAYFHKAEMDNDVYRKPGDRCIFPPRPGAIYPKFEKTEYVNKAIEIFKKYLQAKPGDLEVKWMLNLGYMALGEYPQGVPPEYLISQPVQEPPGESIGRFLDVAPEAGLDVFRWLAG